MKKAILFLALFYMSLASYGSLGESCTEAILLDHTAPITYSTNDTKGELWYRFDAHTSYLHFAIYELTQSPEITLYSGKCGLLNEVKKVNTPELLLNSLTIQSTYYIQVKGTTDNNEMAVALASTTATYPLLDTICKPLTPCNLVYNGDFSINNCPTSSSGVSNYAFQYGRVSGWTVYRGTPDMIGVPSNPMARFWTSNHPVHGPRSESIATCTDLLKDKLYAISLDYNRIYYGTAPQGLATLLVDIGDDGLSSGQEAWNYSYTGIPATQNIAYVGNVVNQTPTMQHHSQLFIPNTDKTKLLIYGKTPESQAQNLLVDNVKITPIVYDDVAACDQPYVTIVQPCASEINAIANISYQWVSSIPGAIISGANTLTPTVATAGSPVLTLQVTIGSGPTLSTSFTVFANSTLPSENVLICGSTPTALTAPGGYTSYQWSTTATSQSILVNSGGTYTCTMTTAQGCTDTKTFNVTQSVINMNVMAEHICYGEPSNSGAVYTLVGGTSYPFSYSGTGLPYSSNGIWNNVSAGTYTVTITDNVGCTASQQVTVLNSPQINISTVNLGCGNADISVSGGIPAYTYAWQGMGVNSGFTATTQDLSNVNAGDYMVVVTDQAGCTENHRVRLRSMEVSTQVTNVECASNAVNNFAYGSVTITNIQNASGPYNFQWSTGAMGVTSINNLQPGTYGLTVTEGNGCQVEQLFTITQPANVTQNFISTDLLCNGDQSGSYEVASSMVSGGTSPYSIYSHSGVLANPAGQVFGNLAAGSYTGTIKTDNGACAYTYTMNIHEPSPLAVIVHCDMTGLNQVTLSANISGGTAPYTYTWGWHDNFMGYMVHNQDAVVNNVNHVGQVNLTVTDANGCTVSWEANPNLIRCRMAYRTARMAQTNNDVEAMVYPSPANDLLYVALTDTDVEIQSASILNSLGQIVAQPTEIEHGMDISSLKAGMYLLQIQTQNGTYTKQFIKE